MTVTIWQRNWDRLRDPTRTARLAVRRANYAITQIKQALEHEQFDPRYLITVTPYLIPKPPTTFLETRGARSSSRVVFGMRSTYQIPRT